MFQESIIAYLTPNNERTTETTTHAGDHYLPFQRDQAEPF
jgi:hypothetical protein